jgi:hypothetical protein
MTEKTKKKTEPKGLTADPYELWNAICITDKENAFGKPTTKEVKARGGFTAIDAYHQIHVATGLWGPMGFPARQQDYESPRTMPDPSLGGWGFVNEDWSLTLNSEGAPIEIVFKGDFWVEGRYVGRFAADVAYRPGDDGYKKTKTDALTKAMSYLGMSADIFCGAWDANSGNKYTEPPRSEAPKHAPAPRYVPVSTPETEDGFLASAPAQGGAGGPNQACPKCGGVGVQMPYWKPGSRSPDLECGDGCVEVWNNKERPLRWWSA